MESTLWQILGDYGVFSQLVNSVQASRSSVLPAWRSFVWHPIGSSVPVDSYSQIKQISQSNQVPMWTLHIRTTQDDQNRGGCMRGKEGTRGWGKGCIRRGSCDGKSQRRKFDFVFISFQKRKLKISRYRGRLLILLTHFVIPELLPSLHTDLFLHLFLCLSQPFRNRQLHIWVSFLFIFWLKSCLTYMGKKYSLLTLRRKIFPDTLGKIRSSCSGQL